MGLWLTLPALFGGLPRLSALLMTLSIPLIPASGDTAGFMTLPASGSTFMVRFIVAFNAGLLYLLVFQKPMQSRFLIFTSGFSGG